MFGVPPSRDAQLPPRDPSAKFCVLRGGLTVPDGRCVGAAGVLLLLLLFVVVVVVLLLLLPLTSSARLGLPDGLLLVMGGAAAGDLTPTIEGTEDGASGRGGLVDGGCVFGTASADTDVSRELARLLRRLNWVRSRSCSSITR